MFDILKQITKNTFTFEEFLKAGSFSDAETTALSLSKLIEAEKIKPVKNGGRISVSPYCERKYRKIREDPIQYDIKPILLLDPKLMHTLIDSPEFYYKYEKEILALNTWLKNESTNKETITSKERAFEIWGDEKAFEISAVGHLIMEKCKLDYRDLLCYPTTEPFVFKEVGDGGTGLILENRDPFISLYQAMSEIDSCLFLNEEIGVVLFGEGNKITRGTRKNLYSSERFCDFVKETFPHIKEWLYAGDIDRRGFFIAERFIQNNTEISVKLFYALYHEMIIKFKATGFSPKKSKDNQKYKIGNHFFQFFEEEDALYIKKILDSNCMIPQETLSKNDYKLLLTGKHYE